MRDLEHGGFIRIYDSATVFEGVLFIFALAKGAMSAVRNFDKRKNVNGLIYTILLHDNVLYFLGVTGLLIFNNLMVVVSSLLSHLPQPDLSDEYSGRDEDTLV